MQTGARKLLLSLLALVVLISVFAGMALTANADDGNACAIDEEEYETIAEAIAAVEPHLAVATTIRLLRDVEISGEEEDLIFNGQNITMDLAGHDLKIINGNGLWLVNGSIVNFIYNGLEVVFVSQWIEVDDGSSLTLPYYNSDLEESGIYCFDEDSSITIDGNVEFSSEQSTVTAGEGGKITVQGDASQGGDSSDWDFIRCRGEGSEITINGNVSSTATAIIVLDDGKITVDGNVDAVEFGVFGFVSEEKLDDESVYGGTVTVTGNITSELNGVFATRTNVTVAGGITAAGSFGVLCAFEGEVSVGADITVATDTPEPLEPFEPLALEESRAVICFDEGSKVEVAGDIAVIADNYANGVICWDGGEVAVSGSINIIGPFADALWCENPGSKIEVFNNITVTGTDDDAPPCSGVYCEEGGEIKVIGSITVTAPKTDAVLCGNENSKVTITGDIIATGTDESYPNSALGCWDSAEVEVIAGNITLTGNGDAVWAGGGATIEINGNIRASGEDYCGGIWCVYGSEVTVNGNISVSGDAVCVGVWCEEDGKVTVNGGITSNGEEAAYIGFGFVEEEFWSHPETTMDKGEGEAYEPEGAAYLKEGYLAYTDQEAERPSYVWVHVDVAPAISGGSTSMTLAVGYGATSTVAYNVSGIPVPEISVSGGEEKVTWNHITKKLDIAAGLAAGIYTVVLTAANGVSPNATLTFTLTVEAGGGPGGTTFTVTFNTNGGSLVESQNVTAGSTATRPPDPTKDNYNFAGWYSDPALTEAYDFTAAVTGNITIYAKWTLKQGTSPGWNNPFTDVKTGDWFYDNVQFVFEKGLMKGISATLFAPNQSMSRAMMITVLARYAGVNTAGGPTWYSQAVAWGMENDITDGTNLDDNVTREQVVAMLWRYFDEPESDGDLSEFSDRAKISEYAVDAMKWAVENGIINGYPDKTLRPQANATRAEVAAIFHRIVAKWGMGDRL
ncbi:MAG: S-layer homology domain-containing protein [Clostridiales bacterium]|nr:S-layer homology domain-containing protein [Clostridiales bacterium]